MVFGPVMLAVTGCEAMYADMGHFGASAIRKSWFAIVFPALLRVAIRLWHWNVALSLLLILPLMAVSAVFLFANSLKIRDGGYVPLGIGLAMFAVMLTWNWGGAARTPPMSPAAP